MAVGEVTGATESELDGMKREFHSQPLSEDHDIPFDVAYCLSEISFQPEDYDGPTRYCKRRASKLKDDEWAEKYDDEYDDRDARSYCSTCQFHGRKHSGTLENLESYTAAITHGLTAEDKHLRMDFNDSEQALYDGIVEQWPEAYDWPTEDEDPARYLMLRKTATNVVRTVRAEDYIDTEGEVRITDVISEDGTVVPDAEQHDENPIAGEYRLLWREITQNLKELGLTPKERAKQSADQKTANALAEIGDAVGDVVLGADEEYDPERFDGDDTHDADAT